MIAISSSRAAARRAPVLRSRPARRSTALALVALFAAGCSHAAREVRIEDLPTPPPADPEYKIGAGDVIGIRVWNQDPMSLARARVREDGQISMPFLQDVEVAGMTPADLARQLQGRLKAYVVNPVVTVTLEELRPLRVSVVGEVTKPGIYDLDRGAGVLAAIAAGGGLTDYAHRDRIYVLRSHRGAKGDPAPSRIRFEWAALARGDRAAGTFQLCSGDLVVVE